MWLLKITLLIAAASAHRGHHGRNRRSLSSAYSMNTPYYVLSPAHVQYASYHPYTNYAAESQISPVRIQYQTVIPVYAQRTAYHPVVFAPSASAHHRQSWSHPGVSGSMTTGSLTSFSHSSYQQPINNLPPLPPIPDGYPPLPAIPQPGGPGTIITTPGAIITTPGGGGGHRPVQPPMPPPVPQPIPRPPVPRPMPTNRPVIPQPLPPPGPVPVPRPQPTPPPPIIVLPQPTKPPTHRPVIQPQPQPQPRPPSRPGDDDDVADPISNPPVLSADSAPDVRQSYIFVDKEEVIVEPERIVDIKGGY